MSELEDAMKRCYARCMYNWITPLPDPMKYPFEGPSLKDYNSAVEKSAPKLGRCVRQVTANFPTISNSSVAEPHIERHFKDRTERCTHFREQDVLRAQSESELHQININFTRCVLQLAEVKQLVYGERLKVAPASCTS